MSLIQCKYQSNVLRMSTDITLILPRFNPARKPHPKFRTLYLLHGFTGDSFDWIRFSNIERFAEEYQTAVVMPCAYNSVYTDMAFGQDYFTYLSTEMADFVAAAFPLSEKREERYVAGCSMGGYGAVKWALARPDFFSAAVSFSGSLHAEDRIKGLSPHAGNQCEGIYGKPPVVDPKTQDVFAMLKTMAEKGETIPRLFLCCGLEDKSYLQKATADFLELAASFGIETTFAGGHGGHTFAYWESLFPQVFEWLTGEKKG